MKTQEIFTIEMNLDDDFANACAYHVDDFLTTSARNIRHCCEKVQTERWALIGLASSLNEAQEKCQKIRLKLCDMHNVKPYGIEDMLWIKDEDADKEKFKMSEEFLNN